MTMLNAGKMNEIADEMLKTQLQIIAVQELRWKGVRQIDKTNYTLITAATQKKSGLFGT
jgi:hypothetical protein